MRKLALITTILMVLAMFFVACAAQEPAPPPAADPAAAAPAPVAPAPPEDAPALEDVPPPEGLTPGPTPYNIPVIIKATDSDYWQILASGALRFMEDHPGLVDVTIHGPPSEADIALQVDILESLLLTRPDAIVIASTSSTATVPAVEGAYGDIPIVTLDNRLATELFVSFLATDHGIASAMVADRMVEMWEREGIDPSGQSVVVISSMPGTAVNTARTNGFRNRMLELVPDIVLLETQYAMNDIALAADIANDLILANPNLIGIFGDNNHMGVGIAITMEALGRQDIVTFAFDANQQQVDAIHTGYLDGIVVQDPFGMGFNGVEFAIRYIRGESLPHEVVVPITLVTIENINNPDIQEMLSYHL